MLTCVTLPVRAGARKRRACLRVRARYFQSWTTKAVNCTSVVDDGESVAASVSRSKAPAAAGSRRGAYGAYLSLVVRYGAAACEIVMTTYTATRLSLGGCTECRAADSKLVYLLK